MNRLVFTNVNLLDGENPAVGNRTLVVEGERIASVGAALPTARDGDRVVDLQGRTVMPGLATCHYHATMHSRTQGGFAPYGYEFPPAYQALIAHHNLMTRTRAGVHDRRRCRVGPGDRSGYQAGHRGRLRPGTSLHAEWARTQYDGSRQRHDGAVALGIACVGRGAEL